jgi:hypothetical protein
MRGRCCGSGRLGRCRSTRNLRLGSDGGLFGNGGCRNGRSLGGLGCLGGLSGWNSGHRFDGWHGCGCVRCGLWSRNRSCCRRLGGNWMLNGVRVGFVGNRSRWRLDHHGHRWRCGGACRARRGRGACGSLGYHRTSRRARGNRGRWGRHNNDGRRRAGLGNDLARLRLGRSLWRRRDRDNLGNSYRRRCRGFHRRMAVPRCCFLLLLLGQNGLQHVAGLRDMRQINLGCHDLRGARCLRACLARGARSLHKMGAHLIGLIVLQGTGVSLAGGQAKFCKHVKNLLALDLQLARENIDSNLTHQPLFELCYPKPLVAHGYLMALAVLRTSVFV